MGKKECKGSFVSSKTWKGYVVCGAPKVTKPLPKLPGTSLTCGADAGPICMGYNIKCFKTTLTTCKSTCKKTPGCKIAEYAASSKTCCTSAIATKKECKGYVVCGAPKAKPTTKKPLPKLPGTSLTCGAD